MDATQRRTIDELEADNMKLRRLLAFRVAGHLLYTDDGELQDASAWPIIDFKRTPIDVIEDALKQRAIAAAYCGKPANTERAPVGE